MTQELEDYVEEVVRPMRLSKEDSLEIIINFIYSKPDIHDKLKESLVADFNYPAGLVAEHSLGDLIRRYGGFG